MSKVSKTEQCAVEDLQKNKRTIAKLCKVLNANLSPATVNAKVRPCVLWRLVGTMTGESNICSALEHFNIGVETLQIDRRWANGETLAAIEPAGRFQILKVVVDQTNKSRPRGFPFQGAWESHRLLLTLTNCGAIGRVPRHQLSANPFHKL